MRRSVLYACGVLFAVTVPAMVAGQAPAGATKSDAEISKEAAEAQALYKQPNMVAALPLYEDLHRQRPENNVYREGLAMALLATAGSAEQPEQSRLRDRAKRLLVDARAAGDNSNLLQVLLEQLSGAPAAPSAAGSSPGAEALKQGEKAFASGDLAGAVAAYAKALEAEPKLYDAPLFAGDAEYKQSHFAEAGQWYAKAIAINPDRETAYRYWGDALLKQGDQAAAESRFIDAIVADPYARTPRIGLKQWADSNHATLVPPPVKVPVRVTAEGQGTKITIDPTLKSPLISAWIGYSMQSTRWRQAEFAKRFPTEKTYRHSLAEEAEGLRAVVAAANSGKIAEGDLDPTLKSLVALEKDGMLESWILLDHADQGIAQDYVAYRAGHRALLHAYVEKYVVHKN